MTEPTPMSDSAPRSSSTGTPAPAMPDCASCGQPYAAHVWGGQITRERSVDRCPPPSLTGVYRPVAPPSRDAGPTAEQLDALRAAGRDPAPYVPTYLTASGAEDAPTPEAMTFGEAYVAGDQARVARIVQEAAFAALGRSLLAALETVAVGDTLAIYSNSDGFGVSRIIGDIEHGNAATRALAAELQRVMG
jgi:hypothetical protein